MKYFYPVAFHNEMQACLKIYYEKILKTEGTSSLPLVTTFKHNFMTVADEAVENPGSSVDAAAVGSAVEEAAAESAESEAKAAESVDAAEAEALMLQQCSLLPKRQSKRETSSGSEEHNKKSL